MFSLLFSEKDRHLLVFLFVCLADTSQFTQMLLSLNLEQIEITPIFVIFVGSKQTEMECLIEESAKKKSTGRHVSFDYVPSEIDFQQNVVLQEMVIVRVLQFSHFKESLVKLGKLEWSSISIVVID